MSTARRRPASYWLSMALLALTAALVIGFFWLGGFFASKRQNPQPQLAREVAALDKRLSLVRNIIMKGKDEQGRDYEIHAGGSRQDEERPDIKYLTTVIGKIEQAEGPPLYFQSRRAIVYEKSNQVDLIDKVIIRKPGKWKLTGPRFRFDSNTHDLASDKPVVAYLDNGTIRARGMKAVDEGARIWFYGPVHARFEEEVTTGGDTATAPHAPGPDER